MLRSYYSQSLENFFTVRIFYRMDFKIPVEVSLVVHPTVLNDTHSVPATKKVCKQGPTVLLEKYGSPLNLPSLCCVFF